MSIIIRLQNLPWEANSLDIRRYFQGLSIPDGGVHIVGGEKGDAFIAFSSDEDARQAMERDGGLIKESRVKLYLSSHNELQKVIEQARNQTLGLKSSETARPNPDLISHSSRPTPSPPHHLSGSLGPPQPPFSSVSASHLQSNHLGPSTVGSSGPISYSMMSGVNSGLGNSSGLSGSPGYPPPETNLRQRPSERDMARMGDNRSRNRSRSRSPLYNRTGLGDHHPPSSSGPYGSRLHSGHMDDSRVKSDLPGYGNLPASMRPNLDAGPPRPPPPRPGYNDAGLGPNGQANYNNNSSGPDGGGWPLRESDGYEQRGKGDPRLTSATTKGYVDPSNGPPPRNLSVELRGLSFNVVPRDIQEFFRPVGLYLPDEAIKILVDDRGYTTGGAIIRCINERDFEAALSRNGTFMGDRRIDIMPLPETCREDELMRVGGPPGPPPPMGVGPPPMGGMSRHPPPPHGGGGLPPNDQMPPPRDYVVYMKGIPYNSCTERDVADFFAGLHCINIVFEIDGRTGKPAGNAFVEFATNEDFNAALDMNMKHMGRRYIEVFPTTREDMNEARRLSMIGPDELGGPPPPSPRGDPRGPTYCVSVTNLPPAVTNRDLTNYFTDIGAQPFAIHIMLKPNGYNAGEAFVEFATKDQQIKAVRKDGAFMDNQRISVRSVPYDLMRRVVGIPPPPMNGGMDHGMRHGSGPPFPPHGDMGDPRKMRRGRDDFRRGRENKGRRDESAGSGGGEPLHHHHLAGMMGIGETHPNFADPRCVVIASNIPYKATNEDICVFFADFDITHDCIARRLNDKGQATADCKVAFRSPDDAAKAVRTMHKKFLIGRPVFLRLAS